MRAATGAPGISLEGVIPIRRTTKFKATAVVAGCAAAGAIAGIAGAAASPGSSSSSKNNPPGHAWRFFRSGRLPGLGRMGDGPAVHETAVVLNKAGTGFITATEDSGTVQSVSGDQLTIKEGIGNVTYKTITLTIPSGATIYRNFATSSLSALKSGDRVRVVQSSEGTSVVAISSNFTPSGHMPFGPGHRWNGSPSGAAPGSYGAPPPGAPMPPTA